MLLALQNCLALSPKWAWVSRIPRHVTFDLGQGFSPLIGSLRPWDAPQSLPPSDHEASYGYHQRSRFFCARLASPSCLGARRTRLLFRSSVKVWKFRCFLRRSAFRFAVARCSSSRKRVSSNADCLWEYVKPPRVRKRRLSLVACRKQLNVPLQ